MSDDQKLNPQITETEVGVRNLRNIKIYPLALGDEMKFTETLSKAITKYFDKMKSAEGMSDVALVGFVLELIKKNFEQIMKLVVEEGEDVKKLMQDVTNYQVAGISRIIYEKNFEDAAKNAGSLSEMVKKLFLSERPLPQFVNDMDILTPDSTETDLPEEESQEES